MWSYLIRLGILCGLHVPGLRSTRDLVMKWPNRAAMLFPMWNVAVVNPVWRLLICCFVWCWNSNRIVVVNWASDDILPLVPLADAFGINFSELFWWIFQLTNFEPFFSVNFELFVLTFFLFIQSLNVYSTIFVVSVNFSVDFFYSVRPNIKLSKTLGKFCVAYENRFAAITFQSQCSTLCCFFLFAFGVRSDWFSVH